VNSVQITSPFRLDREFPLTLRLMLSREHPCF
jgi:hypothetical protein